MPSGSPRLLHDHYDLVLDSNQCLRFNDPRRFGAVVVLKGSGSVIAAPDGRVRVNPTGNARLAIAGTGDVLAGMIAARLAGGEDAFAAASAAVYLHGLAADRWLMEVPLTASGLAGA